MEIIKQKQFQVVTNFKSTILYINNCELNIKLLVIWAGKKVKI